MVHTPVSAQRKWTELDGVRLEENASNDGDSFHAKRNSSDYLFRLYYVDSTETDLRFEDRVQEQADQTATSIGGASTGRLGSQGGLHHPGGFSGNFLHQPRRIGVYRRNSGKRSEIEPFSSFRVFGVFRGFLLQEYRLRP
jgi:hypothetical protein